MADQVTAVPTLDPFAPGFFEDPYAQYAAIREAGPVHRTLFGPWMLTHWEHVHQLLRDPGTSVEDRNAPDAQFRLAPARGPRAHRGRAAAGREGDPQHRSARPHPPAPARLQGVHPADDRAAPPAHRGAGRRPARRAPRTRRRSRRPVGRDQRPGLPAPVRGHQRDARHARLERRRAAPRVVPHPRAGARPDPRGRPTPRRSTRRRTTWSRSSPTPSRGSGDGSTRTTTCWPR